MYWDCVQLPHNQIPRIPSCSSFLPGVGSIVFCRLFQRSLCAKTSKYYTLSRGYLKKQNTFSFPFGIDIGLDFFFKIIRHSACAQGEHNPSRKTAKRLHLTGGGVRASFLQEGLLGSATKMRVSWTSGILEEKILKGRKRKN